MSKWIRVCWTYYNVGFAFKGKFVTGVEIMMIKEKIE